MDLSQGLWLLRKVLVKLHSSHCLTKLDLVRYNFMMGVCNLFLLVQDLQST